MLNRPLQILVALLLTAGPASSQQVRGTVSDFIGGGPLAGALVVLVDADSAVRSTALSDTAGAFTLGAPVGTSLKLRVQRLGFADLESVPITFQNGDSLQLEIRMRPQPVALEGVVATGRPRLRPQLERFLQRREMSFGRTLGPDELKSLPRTSTTILLSSVPGAFLFPGAAGTLLARSRGGGTCQPAIYLDRLRVETAGNAGGAEQGFGVPIGSYVDPAQIMGVEVFRNPAQAPPEFQHAFMPDCPVVLVWTNYSFGIGSGGR